MLNKTPTITTSPPQAACLCKQQNRPIKASKMQIKSESDSGKEHYAGGVKKKQNEFISKCQHLKIGYITGMCILEQTGNSDSNRKHICH